MAAPAVAEVGKSALIWGGSGALGNAIVSLFNSRGVRTVAVDVNESKAASKFVSVKGIDYVKLSEHLQSELKDDMFDAVICVAGGWAGGSVHSKSFLASVQQMWEYNVQSATAATAVSSHLLRENGLLVLTGSASCLRPTGGMVGYGISKAATHHLVASAAETGLPKGTTAVGILPVTLDTLTNRKSMPDADFSSWTPLDEVASKVLDWLNGKDVPKSGSLIQVVTEKSVTKWTTITLS